MANNHSKAYYIHAGVEAVRSGKGRGSIWLLEREVNIVAGVEDMMGNLLPLKEEPEGSTFSCGDLEDPVMPPVDVVGMFILTPLLVLAPSFIPRVGWLLLSVSPENKTNIITSISYWQSPWLLQYALPIWEKYSLVLFQVFSVPSL